MYTELRRINPDLVMDLYAPSEPAVDGNVDVLKSVFDNVHWTTMSRFSYGDFLLRAGSDLPYDVVDAQFHDAGRLLQQFKPIARHRIFTPMECLSRAAFERMQTHFSQKSSLKLSSVFDTILTTRDELKIIAAADETVCVSEADAGFLRRIAGRKNVTFISTGLSDREFPDQLSPDFEVTAPSSRAKRLVFAAYFGSETNTDGLRWYLNQVHSQVLAAVPDYKLMVVGRGDLGWLRGENRPGVSIVGEVPELGPILSQARGGLVLALHGSGFRGKINQYAVCGVPSVSTSLGMTGLCYTPGEDIIRADNAAEFAIECIRVLCDGGYADRIAERARKTALDNYSWSNLTGRVRDVYGV
jgi:glycosyltransferase involved in cell wall biosynthesis